MLHCLEHVALEARPFLLASEETSLRSLLYRLVLAALRTSLTKLLCSPFLLDVVLWSYAIECAVLGSRVDAVLDQRPLWIRVGKPAST